VDNKDLRERFAQLTTAHLADGCIRTQVPVRCAPADIKAMITGSRVAGRVLPTRHVGSVDVFLEALGGALPGDVLVVDNGGRRDESCVGDLIALEAKAAGLEGIVIWGLHRDSAEVRSIGLPMFSLGAIPTGPQRLEIRPSEVLDSARVGDWTVGAGDLVFGDEDGALFVPAAEVLSVLAVADTIRESEGAQAKLIRGGVSLRSQVQFGAYLERRQVTPSLTFRDHLRAVRGVVEE
jgi:regulator of RNase E activity RraA